MICGGGHNIKHLRSEDAEMKSESASLADWQRVAPILDNALSKLDLEDCTALTLRYLEGREIAELATIIGTKEATVRKQMKRGLINLRILLIRGGVKMSTLSIENLLQQHSCLSSPEGLARRSFVAAMSINGQEPP